MRYSVPGHRPRPPFPIAFLLLMALAPIAHAATIRVPSDQPDVRAAVAAAVSGDTILFWPGVHAGGAFVSNKSLTFASRYLVTGDTSLVAQTILTGDANGDCGGAPGCIGNSVLEFGTGADGSAIIGLTLTKGENGVGSASRVDVLHCHVIANGDGVDYTAGAGGTFQSSVFRGNKDDGIDLNGHMNIAIIDNDIRDNADDGIEHRLYAYTGPALEVTIRGNRISGNGEDGVQLIDYARTTNYSIRIEHNLFQANFNATGLSAAIAFMPNGETIESLVGAPSNCRTYVIHNTFVAEHNGVVGGANAIVLNNIFTGITGIALSQVGGNSIASYDLFWTCGTNSSQSVLDTGHIVLGNPQLDSSSRPTAASPAIDAGTATYWWRGERVLDLPPASYADAAPDLGAFESAPNAAPIVSAGANHTVTLATDVVDVDAPGTPRLRADVLLAGSGIDDGRPYPPAPSALWTRVSGPGPVIFHNPFLADTRATFSVPGTYLLQLTVSDGLLSGSDQVEVAVLSPVNMPPIVDAGMDQTVALPARGQLAGTVLDDGLPAPPGAVSTVWTMVSGPGPVTILGAALPSPRVVFATPGVYVFRLSASDGEVSSSDTVTITVLPLPNRPPQVEAGADQTFMYPLAADLDGTVTDDGLPDPPAIVTTTWTMVSGPGAATFQDSSATDTRASFSAPGHYVLRLSASDGQLSVSDLVAIDVQPPPPPFERRIAAASDDAEETANGRMTHNGGNLDLVYDSGNQWVGLRFTNVTVPPGAVVLDAYVQFVTAGASSDSTSLDLWGQAADDPATFETNRLNISARPRTGASVSWKPPPWTVIGEAGPAQRTSDLTSVIQEIIARPGWASGQAMAVIISGTGYRIAHAYETSAPSAALLHIQYGGLAAPAGSQVMAVPAPSLPVEPAGRLVASVRSNGPLIVEFTLADDGPVLLELHDLAGRRLAVRDLGALGPGRHAAEFSETLSTGVYLVRLTQGTRTQVGKAIVIR